MTTWVTGRVVVVQHWSDTLFSLQIEAPIAPFTAGQFGKLALEVNGKRLQRAYSYVNAPQDSTLEFYLVKVPDGQLTEALHGLQTNDQLLVTEQSAGFFILEEIPTCDTLWMLATGTAIGPYLSILQAGHGLARFRRVILVHAVRYARDLSYWPLLQKLQQRYNGQLHLQQVVSREASSRALKGRIPALIASGELEATVGCPIQAAQSHVMLCGNPEMVRDTQRLLQETRMMQKHLRRKPGHITSEHYW